MRKLLILLIIAIAAVLFFLPQILSSPYGKPLFERALGKKFHCTVRIDSLSLSWMGPQVFEQIEFSRPDTNGTIASLESDVPLWSLSEFGGRFLLKGGLFRFSQYNNISIGPVNAQVAGHEINVSGNASQGGEFTLKGKFYSKTDFDLAANLTQMPSAPIDQQLGMNGIFAAAVGPSINLAATAIYNQGEGYLDAKLDSAQVETSLKGQIAHDTLLLKAPLPASLLFSPPLGEALGGRIAGAKHPILLQIEAEGTSIPLRPFAIERTEIGKASLDLGQLVLKDIHPLISFLTLLKRASTASSQTVVWFTPFAMALSRGTLHVGRVDALLDSGVHLCGWGTIDFPGSRLNMRLGIPADTLQDALGIEGLPRNFVLQVPVGGTLQDPEFDTGPAAAKIALLTAGQRLPKISKKTGIFGGLIKQFTQIHEEEDAPPPNRPFPWER